MSFFEQDKATKKENSLWVEKYRPQTLKDYIGNELLKEKVQSYLDNNDVPHLLLYGKAGTGKTTLAKIIANTIECDYMVINASDENSVDVIREKIKSFVSTISFNKFKVVTLDECLEGGTLVTVLRGGTEQKIPIQDLNQTDDLVKSFNLKTNQIEWQPFYLWETGEKEIWEIELENGEVVKCTDTHKWFVQDDVGDTKVVRTDELHLYNHILSPI